MNAQIIKFGTHEFSFGTHESLDIGNFERTKVWTWGLLNARWTHEKFWTHESLDIGTFRLGGSGHRHFPSGTVWTYRLSVWHLNLGSFRLFLLLSVPVFSEKTQRTSTLKFDCFLGLPATDQFWSFSLIGLQLLDSLGCYYLGKFSKWVLSLLKTPKQHRANNWPPNLDPFWAFHI